MECPSGLVNQLDISAGLCSCFAVFSHLEQSPLQKGRHGQRLRQGGLFKHVTFFSLWSFSLIWMIWSLHILAHHVFLFSHSLSESISSLSSLCFALLLFLPLGFFPGKHLQDIRCCTGTCSRRVWKLSRIWALLKGIQMEAAKSAVETWHRFYRWTTSSRPVQTSTTIYNPILTAMKHRACLSGPMCGRLSSSPPCTTQLPQKLPTCIGCK